VLACLSFLTPINASPPNKAKRKIGPKCVSKTIAPITSKLIPAKFFNVFPSLVFCCFQHIEANKKTKRSRGLSFSKTLVAEKISSGLLLNLSVNMVLESVIRFLVKYLISLLLFLHLSTYFAYCEPKITVATKGWLSSMIRVI
jgi:hypothetical protein